MLGYLARRLRATVFVILGVSVTVFAMVRLIPGDPALILAGVDASQEQAAEVRRSLGLDAPIWVQYGRYVARAAQGDFGKSIHSRRAVWREIQDRFPATLELTVVSLVLAGVGGIAVGVVSAIRRNSLLDSVSMVGALAGVSMPVFVLGVLLIWLFAVSLGWLPTGGTPPCGACLEHVRYLVLPALTLAGVSVGMVARLTRSTMLEVIHEDFVRTARAKGLAERLVIAKHALRNALVPVVTYMGLQFGVLMGGAVVTEQIFSWPGLGRMLVEAIDARDYPVIQGAVLFMAVVFVLVNLLVDVLYGWLDPRISHE